MRTLFPTFISFSGMYASYIMGANLSAILFGISLLLAIVLFALPQDKRTEDINTSQDIG